jgi:D-glycero-D-manno-heptose 1,7-bisphosphate phosphatase
MARVDRSWTLFLDRDGVLNRKIEGGYVLNPAMLELLPGAAAAVRALSGRFGTIVIVTNQRGVGRGLMSAADLDSVHERLLETLHAGGGRIAAIFVCPHDLAAGCDCRKPKTGLALQAKARFSEIDFSRSVLVGDSASDVEMGRRLGMLTVGIGAQAPEASAGTFSSLLEYSRSVQ